MRSLRSGGSPAAHEAGGAIGADPVPSLGAFGGEAAEVGHLAEAVRAREGGQLGRDQLQVEGAGPTQLGGPLHGPGPAREAARLLVTRPQVRARAGGQPPVELVEAAAGPHRGHGRGERAAGRGGVVGVGGGDDVDTGADGQLGQGIVAVRVERVAVVAQLDGHVVATEGGHQRVELPGRDGGAVPLERGGHGALATPGEHEPVVAVHLLPGDALVDRLSLLGAGQLGGADGGGEPGVALRVAGQYEQVGALRVRHAVLRLGEPERQLRAEHGGHADGPGRLGEADHAVEPVVVGDGQRLQPEAGRLLGQLLRVAGPVEEAEGGVAVELGVGRGVDPPRQHRRGHVGRPGGRPRRAVTAVGALGDPLGSSRAGAVRERSLQLSPRDVRVVEPHPPQDRTLVRLSSRAVVEQPQSTSAWYTPACRCRRSG